MRKLFFYLFSLFPIYASAVPSTNENEVAKINSQIEELKVLLKSVEVKENNKEVDSQTFFVDDWSAYSKDLQQIHQLEIQQEQIRQQIKLLEERREALIKQTAR